MNDLPLRGRTIAVPETRELDVFAELLARRGASVLRCPLVGIADAPDPAPVLDWIRRFNAGAFDDLVLLTGEGLRRLLSCIERNEPALRAGFLEHLARVRKIARGPKPGRALRELGLKPDLVADAPTTEGVIATLRREKLAGRRIAVQLYGADPNVALTDFLRAAGAQVHTVAPYIYVDAAADTDVVGLVERMAAGTVDAIAFTSKAQVERLFEVAQARGAADTLRAALARTRVAAVGPIVREELAKHGFEGSVMPAESWSLKPLATLLGDELGPRR